MTVPALRLALALIALAPPLAAEDIRRVPYAPLLDTLSNRIDFEDYPRLITPGTRLDTVQTFRGAAIAERFAGQSVAQAQGFDTLAGTPRAPLALAPGRPGENLGVSYILYLTNQLSGLAPPGHPADAATGEGAVAVLFDTDQTALGFRATAEPDPGDPAARRGRMTVTFHRRDGSVIDRLEIALDWGRAGYGFRRADGARDIAGISITNRDPAGIAIDDIVFDEGEVTGRAAGPPHLPRAVIARTSSTT